MNSDISLARKRGRPSSGVVKVVYYRRVLLDMVPLLDEVLEGAGSVKTQPAAVSDAQKAQVGMLLGDVDRLEKALAESRALYERVINQTPDEQTAYWKARCLRAEGGLKSKSDYDQT